MTETNLKELSKSWFLMMKDHVKLMSLESELAQISFIPLVICVITLALFLFSFWFGLLLLLGYGLFLWGLTPIMSILAIVALNAVALLLTYIMMLRYKNRMRFEHTRARIKEIFE